MRAAGAAAISAMLLAGCGVGGDGQADVRDQVEAARAAGEREGRLEERVRQLERDARGTRPGGTRTVVKTVTAPSPRAAPRAEADAAGAAADAAGVAKAGHIVQLGSFTSRADADRQAARLNVRGLGVRVLRSDDYAELRPGYWVPYAGFFARAADAEAAAARAREAGVGDAFARHVTRTG